MIHTTPDEDRLIAQLEDFGGLALDGVAIIERLDNALESALDRIEELLAELKKTAEGMEES